MSHLPAAEEPSPVRDGVVRAGLAVVGVGLVAGAAQLQGAAARTDPAPGPVAGPEAPVSAPSAPASPEPTGSTDSTGSSEPALFGDYTDGTYTATGDYVAHGAPGSITVTLTLADNAVTDVVVEPGAESGASRQFQDRFAQGIAAVVVGVPLDEIEVDKVSGSSLTGDGFTDALARIRDDARA
ncbi:MULTISPECIES: FMN-binding protein [unclassified Nocardiopsis]|uniref:FMN-binding protein n=1 Tax=Nocardiopsis TaxID=2013 RepID=UPI00387B1162